MTDLIRTGAAIVCGMLSLVILSVFFDVLKGRRNDA